MNETMTPKMGRKREMDIVECYLLSFVHYYYEKKLYKIFSEAKTQILIFPLNVPIGIRT